MHVLRACPSCVLKVSRHNGDHKKAAVCRFGEATGKAHGLQKDF